jgi:pumilio family protein 6
MDQVIAMCKSKYAHFFVSKMIKYGTKEQRDSVFKTFEGKISELMKHKIANAVVENYYNDVANAAQRNRMLQEFCGPEFRHFKEDALRTVAQLLEKFPEKTKDIVRHLCDNVSTLINKGCYNHSLVHTVIYNYMQVTNSFSKLSIYLGDKVCCTADCRFKTAPTFLTSWSNTSVLYVQLGCTASGLLQ